MTAAVAGAGAADVPRLPIGAFPVHIAFVLLVLALGTGLTVLLDKPGARPYWQVMLGAVLILMPVVGLQASASRVPFVALSRGSAGPLIWLTLAACIVLCGLWLFAVYQADESPGDAALLFLPAAVLVPAILGAPGSLGENSVLAMLAQSALVAGVAMFLGLVSPEPWRPIAGGVALGAQFILLWALGRGPVLGHDGGLVVPLSAVLLLALTVLLTVVAPLGALFARRFVQTVEEESGGPKPASAPARGARRRDIT